MSITTGTLFRKTIDTIADGSTYRKPTIDEISKLKADGNFFGDIYESTGTDKIIDAISSYIMSVSTGDTLFDLNPSGSGDASLENILLFGEGGRIFLADQTLDFINASGTEIIGRGIRVWESDSKYAKLAFENDAAVLEVVGGTITGGTIQTDTGTGQRIILDGSANTQTFYNSSNQAIITFKGSAGGTSDTGVEVSENGTIAAQKDSNNYFRIYYNHLRFDNNEEIPGLDACIFGHNKYNSGNVYGIFGSAGYAGSGATKSIGVYGLGQGGTTSVGLYAHAMDGTTNNGAEIYGGTNDLILGLIGANNAKLKVDVDGYLNITPSGDRILLWEHSGGGGDVTYLWTDTAGYFNIRALGSGVAEKGYIRIWDRAEGPSDYTDIWTNANADFNIKPMGDGVMIWESAGGAGHYGHMYANTSGIFTIEGGSGGIVFIDDHLNVSGAYRMDGADIISTSAQQTGSFITRTYVSFGRDANLTRTNPGSTTADAVTVDGSLNLQGYRMIRAGVVTGISGQFITSARASDDTITFTVQKNGVNQSMVATKTIVGLGGAGCISTANPFSVVAEDTVNVEMTLTAGDVGTVTISNIAIAVEMLI